MRDGEAEAGAPVTARYEKGEYRFAREKNCDLRLLDFETFGGFWTDPTRRFHRRGSAAAALLTQRSLASRRASSLVTHAHGRLEIRARATHTHTHTHTP